MNPEHVWFSNKRNILGGKFHHLHYLHTDDYYKGSASKCLLFIQSTAPSLEHHPSP